VEYDGTNGSVVSKSGDNVTIILDSGQIVEAPQEHLTHVKATEVTKMMVEPVYYGGLVVPRWLAENHIEGVAHEHGVHDSHAIDRGIVCVLGFDNGPAKVFAMEKEGRVVKTGEEAKRELQKELRGNHGGYRYDSTRRKWVKGG
jgi:hypothetical protein